MHSDEIADLIGAFLEHDGVVVLAGEAVAGFHPWPGAS
jgi:hypothetical protein